MSKRAGIIVIGNEVLSGKVTDINSTHIIGALRGVGMPVRRVGIGVAIGSGNSA